MPIWRPAAAIRCDNCTICASVDAPLFPNATRVAPIRPTIDGAVPMIVIN